MTRDEAHKLMDRLAVLRQEISDVEQSLGELLTPVAHLELSVRAYNVLTKTPELIHYQTQIAQEGGWRPPTAGFTCIGDVTRWSRRDLSKLKNCGSRTIAEIATVLREKGFSLQDDDEFL